jgi:hypothetical protein
VSYLAEKPTQVGITGIGFSMFRICWIVVKEVDYFVSVIFAIMLQKWENEAYFV